MRNQIEESEVSIDGARVCSLATARHEQNKSDLTVCLASVQRQPGCNVYDIVRLPRDELAEALCPQMQIHKCMLRTCTLLEGTRTAWG